MSISNDPGPIVTDTGVSMPPETGGGSLADRLVSDVGADEGDRDTVEPGITHEAAAPDTDRPDTDLPD